MYKIGVIGDKESVLAFMACGFKVFMTEDTSVASEIIANAKDNGFAVIYITETLAQNMAEIIEKYVSEPMPAIIPIPGKDGSKGIGMKKIKSCVERAVGADILFKNE